MIGDFVDRNSGQTSCLHAQMIFSNTFLNITIKMKIIANKVLMKMNPGKVPKEYDLFRLYKVD